MGTFLLWVLAAFPTSFPMPGEGGRLAGWARGVSVPAQLGRRWGIELGMACCNAIGRNMFPR